MDDDRLYMGIAVVVWIRRQAIRLDTNNGQFCPGADFGGLLREAALP